MTAWRKALRSAVHAGRGALGRYDRGYRAGNARFTNRRKEKDKDDKKEKKKKTETEAARSTVQIARG